MRAPFTSSAHHYQQQRQTMTTSAAWTLYDGDTGQILLRFLQRRAELSMPIESIVCSPENAAALLPEALASSTLSSLASWAYVVIRIARSFASSLILVGVLCQRPMIRFHLQVEEWFLAQELPGIRHPSSTTHGLKRKMRYPIMDDNLLFP
jgi:hypothetical protein